MRRIEGAPEHLGYGDAMPAPGDGTRAVSSQAIEEAVRLRRALPDLGVPVDVIVVAEDYAREWGDVYGTVVCSALSQGRVLNEPA